MNVLAQIFRSLKSIFPTIIKSAIVIFMHDVILRW